MSEKSMTRKAMSETVMYIISNSSLKMGTCKLCSQVAHGAIEAYNATPKNNLFQEWNYSGHRKIVLKAPEETLLALIDKYGRNRDGLCCYAIRDFGLTQVPVNSLTVIAFQVCRKDSIPELKELKLL
jgi:peptidyl-tRNA hydrolase